MNNSSTSKMEVIHKYTLCKEMNYFVTDLSRTVSGQVWHFQ